MGTKQESTLDPATSGIAHLRGVTGEGASVLSTPVFATAKDQGATGDGIATENTAFGNLYTNNAEIFIDSGTYKVTPEINLTEKDVHVVVHPAAKFTTAAWDMGPIVKAIGTNPVLAFEALFKDVDADYDIYQHVVGESIFTQANTSGPVVVSLYANCEVIASGSHGFGANFGVYVTGPGTGIVCEIDSHVTDASGLGYALVIDSIGSYASQAAIIIQPNGPDSPFLTGISFNNASGNDAITNNAIQFLNAGEAARFIFSHEDMMFTSAVLDTYVFIIGPSVTSATGALRVDASASAVPKISAWGSATDIGIVHQSKGTGAYQFLGGDGINRLYLNGTTGNTYGRFTNGSGGFTLDAQGTDTNADAIIKGKGNAGVKLQAGGGSVKLEIGDTGIAFFAGTETAKQTVTGSRGSNAALASLLTALANYGLITDSSS